MMVEKATLKIIGISVRTSNVDGKSLIDIPALWSRFFTEDVMKTIPSIIGSTLYCVYTDYESDYMHPYTTVLGCEVENLDKIPDGMTGITIIRGNYINYTAEGDPSKGTVYNKWLEIWNSDIDRSYSSDYEVYDERSQNGDDSVVEIFISVK